MGSTEEQIRALQEQIEKLSNKVGILEDIHAIRRLQHAYGYYIVSASRDRADEEGMKSSEFRMIFDSIARPRRGASTR
jgi:hypothetical protein